MKRDGVLVALAAAHGGLLLAAPVAPVVALGVWWNANTISHNFIHNPFFRGRAANTLFSAYLSLLLGVPQSIWRERHLAHHAGGRPRFPGAQTLVEAALIMALWAVAPQFLLGTLAGLALCALHGYYEHARGAVSHYGALYNFLFFNDGYHVEHHRDPAAHWSLLQARPGTTSSRWPAVLRWLESLERAALESNRLQSFLLASHERAFRSLLRRVPRPRAVGIVGGALFPRTALVLRRLLPDARLVVIDASAENLRIARSRVADVEFVNDFYDPVRHADFDLVVFPLAFFGDRAALYRRPPARAVAVHDWLWNPRGRSALVSLLLLKRLNLVTP